MLKASAVLIATITAMYCGKEYSLVLVFSSLWITFAKLSAIADPMRHTSPSACDRPSF